MKINPEILMQLKKDAAHDSDSGLSFLNTEDLRALLAAYDQLSNTSKLRPVDHTTPTDRPILAWCDHEMDPYVDPNDPKNRLTLYAAHAEGLSHAVTGWHIVEWGGAWDDNTWEYAGGSMPDWWFVAGSDFEVAANPIFWCQLPEVPEYERPIPCEEDPNV